MNPASPRTTLSLCLLVLAAFAWPAMAQSPAPSVQASAGFTILQINDVYKIEGLEGGRIGGLARVRTLRKQIEATGRPVLLLHAGDFLFPSVMSKFLRAQPMIRAMNLLDGDAGAFDHRMFVTFGNHEFDDRDPGTVLGRIAQSDFTWVSANVRYRSAGTGQAESLSKRLANVTETALVPVGGIKVGIIGLTTDVQPRDWLTFGFTDPEVHAVVQTAIDRLRRAGAEFLIALTHEDMDQDVALAKAFPALNLVIGGHEHFFMQRHVGAAWVTKADADAKSAVTIDVSRDSSGRLGIGEPRRVMVDAGIAKDPVVDAEVMASLAELGRTVKNETGRDLLQVVASTEHTLEGVEPAVRGRETALGNFLADVIRDRMGTDLAFLNGGAIRINDDIPAGSPVRLYDLEGVFYFDNQLAAFELTGADLLEVLRTSVALVHSGHGRFLQVSNIRFKYAVDSRSETPTYRIDASDVQVRRRGAAGFEPLKLDQKYTVGSLDYLWENGYRDGYALFSKGRGGTSPARVDDPATSVGWRKATEDALAALPDRKITTAIDGRIVRVDAGPAK